MRKELPVGGFPTATKFDPHAVYPLHMYHETLPPRIAHTATEEEENRADGYGTEYIHQEYPKHVTNKGGIVALVGNQKEERAFLHDGPDYTGASTKTLNSAEEEVGLTSEKKDDPFGIKHPPVPTSNAEDLKKSKKKGK